MMSSSKRSDMSVETGKGQIQVIFGPMFSGKSTELIRRMKRYKIANYSCLLIKYANDNRYDDDGVATHDRQVLPAVSTHVLTSLTDAAMKSEVIGIDEGQFFPDIVSFSEEMADQGKTVIVAALDGTYQRKGFNDILNLIPLAECVVKLNAVCMVCYSEASYTKRKGSETEVEVIGGADKYLAVCRECFKSPRKESSNENNNPHHAAKPAKVPNQVRLNRKLFQEIENAMETQSGA